MKVRVKTAHGYLSLQPDGRWEFRDEAGTWEEFDIEGLSLEPVPGPGPTPPVVDDPAGPAEPTAAYVARVKAYLQSQGVKLTGSCGAFEITKRVAWGLRAQGYGLLSKPGGNQCEGYATDIVMHKDAGGDIVDVLGDGGNGNTPIWQVTDTVDPARWRPPVQP